MRQSAASRKQKAVSSKQDNRLGALYCLLPTAYCLLLTLVMLCAHAMDASADEQQQPPSITSGGAGEQRLDQPAAGQTTEPGAAPSSTAPSSAPTPTLTQEEQLHTPVSLSFTNANLKNVLNGLAKTYRLNIVAGEDVNGTVTLTLRDVALQDALRQMLKLNGFGFTLRDGIIEIAKLKEKRVGELIHLKYLAPDTALEFIHPLASEGSVLKADEVANAILVSDYLSNIQAMRDLLADVDNQPQQVLIESKLLDIRHTDLDNLGLSLTKISDTIALKSRNDDNSGTRLNPKLLLSSGSVNLPGPAASSDIPTGQFVTTATIGSTRAVTATLDALIRDKRVKVIANPTILTVNNVEAKITIGEKFPIREQTQTTTGTLQTTRFVDVGTTLRVTPKITNDGYIQMHLHPEVSAVSATLDAGPRVTTREADTTVILRDGQSLVIAGLLQEDETLVKGKVPILADIPFIGLLFQNRSKSNEQKELVIVITPHLINVSLPSVPVVTAAQQVAARLDVEDLFEQAAALDTRTSLQARQMPEIARQFAALEAYRQVVAHYPTHPYAMESLWRIGRIARDRLHDLDEAGVAYQQLIAQFPEGKYRAQAEWKLNEILRRQARRHTATASSH